MLTGSPYPTRELEIAGIPAVGHLHHGPRLSQQLLDHLAPDGGGTEPAALMPCGVGRRDAAEVVTGCLDLVAAALQDGGVGEVPAPLHRKIEDWAAEGVALEAVQHSIHRGFRFVLDLLARRARTADGPAMVVVGQRLGEVLDRVITTFTQAYLREFRAHTVARYAGAEALTTALISGTSTAGTARESGFREATAYAVLALDLTGPPGETGDDGYGPAHAPRRLRRVRAELARGGDMPLARLSEAGGTVLLPDRAHDDLAVTRLFDRLQSAVRGSLLATVVHARHDEVPDATRRAHELLDLAQRLRRPARLYRLADLAVEYQITRPGPARKRLATALEPLLPHADLLQTLATHLDNDRNRRRTARVLGIHANTLDYRLRRIARYTGLDPASADDLWHLRAALVAGAYETCSADTPVAAADRESPQPTAEDSDIGRSPGPPIQSIDIHTRARVPAPARGR
ncbi:helix-turn-helix domain-containing protein [Nocardia rhamnosiphila]|uniref:PucR family transcriptional regulator n=1 Tax=Nocardia rhamnosiphila TaxID=426716 RepID=UPI0033C0954E